MQCSYCGYCAPCPRGIDIAAVIRLLEQMESQSRNQRALLEEYKALPRPAGRCVACRQCESRCQSCVAVVKKMRRAQKVFGC